VSKNHREYNIAAAAGIVGSLVTRSMVSGRADAPLAQYRFPE
jgi:hypothetical protein